MKKIILSLLLLLPLGILAQNKKDFIKEQFRHNGDTLLYRILYPENFSEEKSYPILFFLHGAGERGNDNEAQLAHGSNLFLNADIRKKYPAIIVAPQAPKDDYWAKVDVDRTKSPLSFNFHENEKPTQSLALVIALLDSLQAKKYVDNSRMYVGGLSMGGMGTFEMLARKPDTFAAAFAICGAANPEIVQKYNKDLKIWIFHGEKDDVVNPEYSKAMAREINSAGMDAKLSLYPNDNHNSWDSAFAEPSLFPWLFSKSKN